MKSAKSHNKSSITKFYDVLAPVYSYLRDRGHRRDHSHKNLLINRLSPFEGDNVLDIGTGPGIYALDIARMEPTSQVHGIDISKAFISIAKDRADTAGAKNINFAVGDINNLDFGDGCFNKIICAGVISVLSDRPGALSEMSRVLSPGGKVAIRDPLRSDGWLTSFGHGLPDRSSLRRWLSRFGLMFGHFSPDFLSEAEFRDLFDAAEFSSVEYELCGSDLLVVATK